jgi:hypothetical protein
MKDESIRKEFQLVEQGRLQELVDFFTKKRCNLQGSLLKLQFVRNVSQLFLEETINFVTVSVLLARLRSCILVLEFGLKHGFYLLVRIVVIC